MKTKIIPFDLETAKKIQAGEVEGKIKTRDSKHKMRIVCYNSTARFCGSLQPIIAQDIEDCEGLYAYSEDGAYIEEKENPEDLVLEVPDDELRLKPFDKVLVREGDLTCWQAAFFSHVESFEDGERLAITTSGDDYNLENNEIIPYEGNEYLLGTTDKPKED